MSNSRKIPNVGDIAPDFELVNEEMKNIKLSEINDKKIILAFFPAADSPVCTNEMCNFRDRLSDLNNKNTQVIGISIDGPFANKFFKEHYQLNFPLLSDYNREVIKKYNVVMKDLATLKDYNAAKRAIFIIDKDKKITYRWISDSPLIEPDYQEIIINLQEKKV